MDNEIGTIKKGFGSRLKTGLGFLVNVDLHAGFTFLMMTLSNVPYYLIMGRIVSRLMNSTTDQLMSLLSGDGVSSLLHAGEQTALTVSLLVSIEMGFFLSLYYAIMFLKKYRNPGWVGIINPGVMLRLFAVLALRAFFFLGLYYLCNISLFFLVLLLRPLSVYSICCRADRQRGIIQSITDSFAVMKGQMLRSVLYTALAWMIISGAGALLGAVVVAFLPEHTAPIMAITLAVTNTVYIIAYTRMFTAMYADNVPEGEEEVTDSLDLESESDE